MNRVSRNLFLDGLLGMAVGDALGVPFEACTREYLKNMPVVGMVGYREHNQPEGSWSDDTSMALCSADSLCRGFDPYDMMKRFIEWKDHRQYTAADMVFDIGVTTRRALDKFKEGAEPEMCGRRDEGGNGNGGLMRMYPVSLWCAVSMNGKSDDADMLALVHTSSALTHAHERGLVCCGIYTLFVCEWLVRNDTDTPLTVAKRAFDRAKVVYSQVGGAYKMEMDKPGLFIHPDELSKLPEESISSGGYVVDTLHAAFWCLLTTGSYSECVLKAVNLGDDTDTTAAVAGSLAGLVYGAESIPVQWLEALKNRRLIEDIAARLDEKVCGPRKIDSFTGRNAHMALKAGTGMTIDGVEYKNAYAAYLALMTLPEYRDQFSGLNAHQARRLFKQLPTQEEASEEEALYTACMTKYSQNSELREMLLETGDMDIIYDTTGAHDNHMGRCRCRKCAGEQYGNLLGRTLMRVRRALRNTEAGE